MKTVLVTGGAGFIGSNFIEYLHQKYPQYKILVLDALTYAGEKENIPRSIHKKNSFEFWKGSVQNADLVDSLVERCDVIVHFAAETHVARSIYDNSLFYQTDVIGTHTIANAVLKHRKKIERFIHISTSEVYGTAMATPMSEDHLLNPMSPYASAKAGADRLVYSYWATYELPIVIIRPFNNYGPRQHLEKAIPRFITSAILGEPITIHGDGKSSRDWLHVSDHCEALDRVLHAPLKTVVGEAINIGTDRCIPILAVAQAVLKQMEKKDIRIKHIYNRPGQVDCHIADIKKAKKLLKWKPKIKFEDGLSQTVEWYVKNEKWWKSRMAMRHVPIANERGKFEYH